MTFMSTPFTNIYARAVASFEDPSITNAYQTSLSDFCDILYNYLSNAIPLFNIPKIMQAKLVDRTIPNLSISDYGQFNQTLSDREEKILSSLLVQCWAEKEKNFLLDIRRLLNDTDFKLSAESTTIREKGGWYNSIRENSEQAMKQYSWDLYIDAMNNKYGLSS